MRKLIWHISCTNFYLSKFVHFVYKKKKLSDAMKRSVGLFSKWNWCIINVRVSCYNVIKMMVCVEAPKRNVTISWIWTNIRALSNRRREALCLTNQEKETHKVNIINTELFNHFVHAHSYFEQNVASKEDDTLSSAGRANNVPHFSKKITMIFKGISVACTATQQN